MTDNNPTVLVPIRYLDISHGFRRLLAVDDIDVLDAWVRDQGVAGGRRWVSLYVPALEEDVEGRGPRTARSAVLADVVSGRVPDLAPDPVPAPLPPGPYASQVAHARYMQREAHRDQAQAVADAARARVRERDRCLAAVRGAFIGDIPTVREAEFLDDVVAAILGHPRTCQ